MRLLALAVLAALGCSSGVRVVYENPDTGVVCYELRASLSCVVVEAEIDEGDTYERADIR